MNRNMERARQSEEQTLQAIGTVGWLTTAQVAAWVWPASGAHSARNRAAEVLGRLVDRGFVMRRQTTLGTWAYLLTNTGAARANASLDLEACRNGYDLSQLDTLRQSIIVEYLLAQDSTPKLGPAGIRGWARCGMLDSEHLVHADVLTWDPFHGSWRAAIVVRSLHPSVLAKARRIRAAAVHLELLGHPWLVQQFVQQLGHRKGGR